MNRTAEHVLAYFVAELGTVGNIGNNGEMTLTGKYRPKNVNKLIRKYAKDYVKCEECNKYNTEFVNMKKERATKLVCNSCGASTTIDGIVERYVSLKKGERIKVRA